MVGLLSAALMLPAAEPQDLVGQTTQGPFKPDWPSLHAHQDPEICHGKPTFKGTRIMVWQVLDDAAEGRSWDFICNTRWGGRIPLAAVAEAVRLSRRAWLDREIDALRERGFVVFADLGHPPRWAGRDHEKNQGAGSWTPAPPRDVGGWQCQSDPERGTWEPSRVCSWRGCVCHPSVAPQSPCRRIERTEVRRLTQLVRLRP